VCVCVNEMGNLGENPDHNEAEPRQLSRYGFQDGGVRGL